MDSAARIHRELHAMRRRLPEVSGVVLASSDGLRIASDTPAALDPDPVAAMAATSLGFGRQFARMAGYGSLQESVFQAADGLVVTYPAGERALLAVLARRGVDPALLHAEARAVASRLGALYEEAGGWDEAHPMPTSDTCAPRTARSVSPFSSPSPPTRHTVLRPPGRP